VSAGPTLRARFTKLGKVRFLSHRDLARVWERALRRVELPIAYTAGFSPRPKLHFGLALSTGHESLGEYLEVDLDAGVEVGFNELIDQLNAVLPDGVDCVALAAVSGHELSLQQAVTSCSWSIVVDGGTTAEAADAVDALLAANTISINRERKGRPVTDDIRPYVRSLHLDPAPPGATVAASEEHGQAAAGGVALLAELGTQPRTLRPAELVTALGSPWVERRVCRLHQWIDHDGTRTEPLTPAAAPAWTRTSVRAS
jgi:radical SAM-linked protein